MLWPKMSSPGQSRLEILPAEVLLIVTASLDPDSLRALVLVSSTMKAYAEETLYHKVIIRSSRGEAPRLDKSSLSGQLSAYHGTST